jgi:hypothetical protein
MDETDDVAAAVESEELSVDGDPPDVELLDEELLDVPVDDVSLGPASAIAGLPATAIPTPSATANAPSRPM